MIQFKIQKKQNIKDIIKLNDYVRLKILKNVYKSLKIIINENLEYDLDILYLLLNIKSITLNITKKKSLHNFILLEKKNKGKYYDERNIGFPPYLNSSTLGIRLSLIK